MSDLPHRGDVIYLDFNPQAGREQDRRRPALVLTDRRYNQKTSLCVVCPITSVLKGYPFEIPLPKGLPVYGAILVDHIKNLDWQARRADVVCAVSEDVVEQVLDVVADLLQM